MNPASQAFLPTTGVAWNAITPERKTKKKQLSEEKAEEEEEEEEAAAAEQEESEEESERTSYEAFTLYTRKAGCQASSVGLFGKTSGTS